MNTLEFHRNIKRRKTDQIKLPKIKLDLIKINKSKFKFSISPRKKRKSNNSKNIHKSLKNINFISNQNKKLIQKHVSLQSYGLKRSSKYNPFRKYSINNKEEESKRHSLGIVQSRTKKLFQRYNLKMDENNIKKKSLGNRLCLSKKDLNILENNIKNKINYMRKEIEKKVKTPEKKRIKISSSPDLKFIFSPKKSNKKFKKNQKKLFQSSLLIKKSYLVNYSFDKKDKIKRNLSFDYSEKVKKKLIIKFMNKIKKPNNELISIQKRDCLNDDDSDINKDNDNGFAFHPNNKFIFIFDLLLIISNLYTFIIVPISVAKNKDIRRRGTISIEIIHFFIDLIFLFDFIINLFRGYYNYEMNIITNNKKIIFHYFKNYFILDFIQALPLYTIIRIFLKPNENIYLGYSGKESLLISFMLFIKPFKIFKIIKKNQNRALEEFFSYLSENYYLEQLAKFIIYFIIFFLFIHLFICLHIYFAFQNYPNWITHINIINDTLFVKYVTSLYFMITTITTVGYGDIICISFIERIYHIILLVIGTLLYTFLVSKIGNYLRDQSHEQIKLSKDLSILENIRVTYPSMPFKLYSKIKNHLQSIFNKRKKTGISLLINGVPDAIKNDLLFKIYSKVINEFKIFKNIKNSSFVIHILTSFIPIVSKKEEIIVLEGEIIQNIVFVKDGRLSMEISIDLNAPYKSYKKYLEMDYTGNCEPDDLKNNNILNKTFSAMNNPEKNYNDLKAQIDNVILYNQNTLINNSRIDNNGISVDLGRLEFSRNDIDNIDNENLQIIKIIDVRKNEHYGDTHILTESPSPFTLKAKSRIAELLLLRKYDVILISKNFPNIWRRIQSKSYHNLISIKKLTFKILKRYFNLYFYNKETFADFNLDATKNSEKSSFENRSFLKNLKAINRKSKLLNDNNNKMINKYGNLHLKNCKTNNYINKNNLFIGYENKRKNSAETFSNDLELSFNFFDSNYFDNSNSNKNKKDELSIVKIQKHENDINKNVDNKKNNDNSKNIIKNKSLENFSFKNVSGKTKSNLLSPKKLMNKSKSINFKFRSNLDSIKESTLKNNSIFKGEVISGQSDRKSSINETVVYNQNGTEIKNDNESYILTLEDINQNFSRRIKKKIKKKKRIQKIKDLVKLEKIKINNNLLNQNIGKIMYKNCNIIDIENNYSSKTSSSKIFSQILDSSSSSENNSTIIFQNKRKFEIESLKISSFYSFEIKSSYNNINLLSYGKMIKNLEYKKNVENIIKNYNYDYESLISSISPKNKNIKRNEESEIKNNNDDTLFSEGNFNTQISNSKNNKIIEELNQKQLSNKSNSIKGKKTTSNLSNLKDNKTQMDKKSKFFENSSKIKKVKFKTELDNEIKTEFVNFKKKSKSLKKNNKIKKQIDNITYNSSNVNNLSLKSSINVLNEKNNKYINSKNENNLEILNKDDNNISYKNFIQANNFNNQKKKCIIY